MRRVMGGASEEKNPAILRVNHRLCLSQLPKGTHVTQSLPVLKNTAAGCGTCGAAACGSCSPAGTGDGISRPTSRRELARTALISAAAVLTGCSKERVKVQAPEPPASNVSPDLVVIQKSKGP